MQTIITPKKFKHKRNLLKDCFNFLIHKIMLIKLNNVDAKTIKTLKNIEKLQTLNVKNKFIINTIGHSALKK